MLAKAMAVANNRHKVFYPCSLIVLSAALLAEEYKVQYGLAIAMHVATFKHLSTLKVS